MHRVAKMDPWSPRNRRYRECREVTQTGSLPYLTGTETACGIRAVAKNAVKKKPRRSASSYGDYSLSTCLLSAPSTTQKH